MSAFWFCNTIFWGGTDWPEKRLLEAHRGFIWIDFTWCNGASNKYPWGPQLSTMKESGMTEGYNWVTSNAHLVSQEVESIKQLASQQNISKGHPGRFQGQFKNTEGAELPDPASTENARDQARNSVWILHRPRRFGCTSDPNYQES